MTRLLLSAALAAGAFFVPVAAEACELRQCPWAEPVCSRVSCTRPILITCENVAGRTVCV